MSIITCVSGYWDIPNKHGSKSFESWFNFTLKLNCPYIFFGTAETILLAKKYRNEENTYYIELNIEEFSTYKYIKFIQTHPTHCPSKELNLVWNEKIFLIDRASKINPFNSQFFMWVDAGICIYRNIYPPQVLNINLFKSLPTHKFIFTSSENNSLKKFDDNEYYHYVSGTSYIYSLSFVKEFTQLYLTYVNKLLPRNNWIFTDQVILTHIYRDNPNLFHKLGHGYGEIANYVFSNTQMIKSEFVHNTNNSLIICAVFKNEAHILSEWIQHYLNRGVKHIYLVNDNSTDNFQEIISQYSSNVTLFNNDINTKSVGKQIDIYNKYFKPILKTSKWVAILDLDEFLYSPENVQFDQILEKYDKYSQICVDWLHFGSNDHKYQPSSVISGFTKRSIYNDKCEFYSYKSIFKSNKIISINIHKNDVTGETIHLKYDEKKVPLLVINHYNLQSLDFYLNIKCTRGDCDNWFDHIKKTRNIELFNQYNINDVEDLRLFYQSKFNASEKVFNTDEVTLVITSCNRPLLLDKTLQSFVNMNTYPIKITYLIDDSGKKSCNDEIIKKYTDKLNIKSIYNEINIGQIQSIDKVYSYVTTKWIFHCEEDWEFICPSFIEKSLDVFNENKNEKIYTVWLRPHNDTSGHPIIKDNLNRGYFMMKKDFSYYDNNIKYTWGGITFNPGLRKTIDCLKFHPYSFCCDKMYHNKKEYVGEYTINSKYLNDGYYSMILSNPMGHVKHIGWDDHIQRQWEIPTSNFTFVTGCWDIGRGNMDNTKNNHDWKRSFKTYTDMLENLLSTNLPIICFGDENLKDICSKYKNCKFVLFSIDRFTKTEYYTSINTIRTSNEWINQPTAEWLKSSPQALLPLYVPIQLNKIHCIDEAIKLNPYNSTFFYWLDAGITRTHNVDLLKNMCNKLVKYGKFLFLSHKYISNTEIHGFLRKNIHEYCGVNFVDRIMKGFLFGGNIDKFDEILTLYKSIVLKSLSEKLMGADESIFTIMVNQRPDLFDQVIINDCIDTPKYL